MQSSPADAFILKWSPSGGSELGSSQAFILDLCDLLDIPAPNPPRSLLKDNYYGFEIQGHIIDGTGATRTVRYDCIWFGRFLWESKQGSHPVSKDDGPARIGTGVRGTPAWDRFMLAALRQAEQYARHIPADKGRPVFLLISDIGYVIELYSDFEGTGLYSPYPSPQEHRITMDQLRSPEIRERLRQVFMEPTALDPSREKEKVTNDIAVQLGTLAKSLEASGNAPEDVANFLMRCVMSMFLEDMELLPRNSFTLLLEQCEKNPGNFHPAVKELWDTMYSGGYSSVLDCRLPRFQGSIYENNTAIELTPEQLALLKQAALANWSNVESSIFGTLLERALVPAERYKLGAYYSRALKSLFSPL